MSAPDTELIRLHDLVFEPFISEQEINERVTQMGAAIHKDLQGKRPLFISVLNGAFIFAADLLRACPLECEMAFVKLRSYAGTESTGQIKKVLGLDIDISGREVVIIEDIVDTGHTLHNFLSDIQSGQPASIRIASLLLKPASLREKVEIDYLGFEIPNDFVVGYGLDYEDLGRNLKSIYRLHQPKPEQSAS